MTVRLGLAAAGVLIAVAGCGRQPTVTGPPLFLPKHALTQGGPTGLIMGMLTIRDGCAWIATPDGGRDLVLWPQGTRIDVDDAGRVEIVDVNGAPGPLVDGMSIALGGGEYSDQGFVEQTIDASIPAECLSPLYWLATTWTERASD